MQLFLMSPIQLCGVRGGGNAAAQALFWQAKRGLSFTLAFEAERDRNAAIMLARRCAFDCNVSFLIFNHVFFLIYSIRTFYLGFFFFAGDIIDVCRTWDLGFKIYQVKVCHAMVLVLMLTLNLVLAIIGDEIFHSSLKLSSTILVQMAYI